MNRQHFPTEEQKSDFVRLQLEVEALLDLPDESDPGGATGPDDRYFALGRRWVRFFFTGSYFTVREYMRPVVLPYADLTLDFHACVVGMAELLAELRALDEAGFVKAVDGVFRARRYARQKADGVSKSERGQTERTGSRPGIDVARAASPSGVARNRQFPLRLHAVSKR